MYWASEIEWPVVGPSKYKKNKGMLFWKGQILRVAVGQKGLTVVTVSQYQNKWV
jgi:hypothetical protein